MRIVVIGGSGLIGTKLVARLQEKSHEAIAASPRTGVDALTGEGLSKALVGADVVVDVANSPSFEDQAVLDFFERSGRNLLAAEAHAGVKHHVALSIVKTDLLPENGYFRAKVAQENLIKRATIPYTIVRATQFFEFIGTIAKTSVGADGRIVVPAAQFQPIAADDVAATLADVAVAAPLNGTIDIAGPDKSPFRDFVVHSLRAAGDVREVFADAQAGYFGSKLAEDSLTPEVGARLGSIRFETWLAKE